MRVVRILRTVLLLLVLISNIACDRISKNIVREQLVSNERISLISKYLTLTRVENTGAFLSLGAELPKKIKILILTIIPLIVLGLAVVYLVKSTDMPGLALLGIAFAAGGGIGNIYDRLFYGSVTDFLNIDFVIFHTGIFNMADVSLMVGIFIFAVSILVTNKTKITNKAYE